MASRSTLAAGIAAGLIAGAGGAYAASGGQGTITVCVSHSHGTLYKARKCKKHDKKLTWNVQGPQGQQGIAGKNGTNGINGANGANGAVAGYSTSSNGSVDITGTSKTILTLSLPAGSYIVNSKAVLHANAGSAGYANDDCRLVGGGGDDTSTVSTSLVYSGFIYFLNAAVPTEIAASSSSPMKITLTCSDDGGTGSGFSTQAEYPAITAVQTTANH